MNEQTNPAVETLETSEILPTEEELTAEEALLEAADALESEESGEEESEAGEEEEGKRWVSHEEALRLILEGVNPMSLRSELAPHGYKKDGTAAAQRGRKLGSGKKRVLANPNHGNAGRKLVKTEACPHGMKLDGTAMKKRGRPTKEQTEAKKLLEAAQQAQVIQAVVAASDEDADLPGIYRDPLVLCEELPEETPVVETKIVRKPGSGETVQVGSYVRLVEQVCHEAPVLLKREGKVLRIDERFALVSWHGVGGDWRPLVSLECP